MRAPRLPAPAEVDGRRLVARRAWQWAVTDIITPTAHSEALIARGTGCDIDDLAAGRGAISPRTAL